MSAPSVEKMLLEQGLVTSQQIDYAWRHISEQAIGEQSDILSALIELGFIQADMRPEIENRLSKAAEQVSQVSSQADAEANYHDPIVQILLQENQLQASDLEKAMELKRVSDIPIREGTAILEIGAATQEMIQQAMKQYYQKNADAAPPPKPYESSHTEGTQFQGLLGQILLKLGYIDDDQLQKALKYQYHLPRSLYEPLGEIMISLGFLNPQQVDAALAHQAAYNTDPFTLALIDMELIEDWQLSYARSMRSNPEYAQLSLVDMLVKLGYTSEKAVEALRARFEGQT
ncbi:MAG: hypothetical protein IV090_24445 [Candidatus Sericytochromatia bacterium]|nr:hypothetical protein [Candidatus Sericytochromatia bacterium]